MSYIDDTLLPGEKLLYEARMSWWAFAPRILLVVLFTLPLAVMVIWPIVADILVIGHAWLTIVSSEFAVTDRRIIAKTGFISRTATEIPLGRIESANIDQSVIGRLADYGTVAMTGTGGAITPFTHIANPMGLRQAAMAAVESTRRHQR